jgi:transcriptional regulator GlxA family with amidase domain
LLATAGLLRDATAATHWLAGPILERHGAQPSPDRLVVAGPLVTCTGRASAYDAALVVARSYGGAELVERILADLARVREEAPPPPVHRSWRQRRRDCAPRPTRSPSLPAPPPPGGRVTVMIELEETGPATRRR